MEQDNQGSEGVVLSFISYMECIELVQNRENTLIQSSIFNFFLEFYPLCLNCFLF